MPGIVSRETDCKKHIHSNEIYTVYGKLLLPVHLPRMTLALPLHTGHSCYAFRVHQEVLHACFHVYLFFSEVQCTTLLANLHKHIWDRLVLVTSLRGQPIEVAMVCFLQLGLVKGEVFHRVFPATCRGEMQRTGFSWDLPEFSPTTRPLHAEQKLRNRHSNNFKHLHVLWWGGVFGLLPYMPKDNICNLWSLPIL